MSLRDIRQTSQAFNLFPQQPQAAPDESQDYFVDPSVTGATTYTNQLPPRPVQNGNALRLSQMRQAQLRVNRPFSSTGFRSLY